MRKTRIVTRSVWKTAEGRFSVVVLGIWIAVSLLSLVWTPCSLWSTDGYDTWASPSTRHWLGTDGTGADVFSWLMAGSRTDLVIAVLATMFSAALGFLLIGMTASRSNVFSNMSVVLIDALISIPTILIALVLAVPLGASVAVVVIACGIGHGLNLARVCRPQALLAARSGHAKSALSAGAGGRYVLLHHVLPNILPTLIVQLSLSAGTAVLAESGLTYLGVGVPSGVPSWGHSLATSVKFVDVFPITVIWPGLLVTVVVVALNMFGDCLRNAVDPVSNAMLRKNGAVGASEEGKSR